VRAYFAIPVFAALIGVSASGFAQTRFRDDLKQMKVEQKLGNQVPADAVFKDEYGNDIKFASLLGKRPLILLPIFYACRGICGKETDNLLKTVAKMQRSQVGGDSDAQTQGKQVGRDYDIVFLSIHPKETPALAMNKKTSLLNVMKGETNQEGYHFLTGQLDQIRRVTDAVGFGFAYDPADGRINHPAGLMFLTPSGRVSKYILGNDYPKPEVEQALALAQQDKIGKQAEVILLGCVMIDPVTGARSLVIENVIRLIAGIFAVGVFTWIGSMMLKNRRAMPKGGTPTRA
jgi:protein SCO1